MVTGVTATGVIADIMVTATVDMIMTAVAAIAVTTVATK
jgi:hypothetical protein